MTLGYTNSSIIIVTKTGFYYPSALNHCWDRLMKDKKILLDLFTTRLFSCFEPMVR